MSAAGTVTQKNPVETDYSFAPEKVDYYHVFERLEEGAPVEMWLVLNVEHSTPVTRIHSQVNRHQTAPVRVKVGQPIPDNAAQILIERDGHITLEHQHPHAEGRYQVRLHPKELGAFLKKHRLTIHKDRFGYPVKWRILNEYNGLWAGDVGRKDAPEAHPLWEEVKGQV